MLVFLWSSAIIFLFNFSLFWDKAKILFSASSSCVFFSSYFLAIVLSISSACWFFCSSCWYCFAKIFFSCSNCLYWVSKVFFSCSICCFSVCNFFVMLVFLWSSAIIFLFNFSLFWDKAKILFSASSSCIFFSSYFLAIVLSISRDCWFFCSSCWYCFSRIFFSCSNRLHWASKAFFSCSICCFSVCNFFVMLVFVWSSAIIFLFNFSWFLNKAKILFSAFSICTFFSSCSLEIVPSISSACWFFCSSFLLGNIFISNTIASIFFL